MATYKGIQGYTVQKLSSDRTSDVFKGELYYNSGSGKFKVVMDASGSWASAGTLGTGRYSGTMAGRGTNTAALFFTGQSYPDTGSMNKTEEYNGSSWSAKNNLNTGRKNQAAGAGTAGAALCAAGGTPTDSKLTEEFDGTNWSEQNDLLNIRTSTVGAGTQTAALCIGGSSPPYTPAVIALVESWDGTCWTAGTALNTARNNAAGGGTQTSAFYCCGGTTAPSPTNVAETWDGSAWTTVDSLNTARTALAGTGDGSTALAFGGYTGSNSNATEYYNGSSWAEIADMGTARRSGAGGGAAATEGVACGGDMYPASPANPTALAEKWSGESFTLKTVTVS